MLRVAVLAASGLGAAILGMMRDGQRWSMPESASTSLRGTTAKAQDHLVATAQESMLARWVAPQAVRAASAPVTTSHEERLPCCIGAAAALLSLLGCCALAPLLAIGSTAPTFAFAGALVRQAIDALLTLALWLPTCEARCAQLAVGLLIACLGALPLHGVPPQDCHQRRSWRCRCFFYALVGVVSIATAVSGAAHRTIAAVAAPLLGGADPTDALVSVVLCAALCQQRTVGAGRDTDVMESRLLGRPGGALERGVVQRGRDSRVTGVTPVVVVRKPTPIAAPPRSSRSTFTAAASRQPPRQVDGPRRREMRVATTTSSARPGPTPGPAPCLPPLLQQRDQRCPRPRGSAPSHPRTARSPNPELLQPGAAVVLAAGTTDVADSLRCAPKGAPPPPPSVARSARATQELATAAATAPVDALRKRRSLSPAVATCGQGASACDKAGVTATPSAGLVSGRVVGGGGVSSGARGAQTKLSLKENLPLSTIAPTLEAVAPMATAASACSPMKEATPRRRASFGGQPSPRRSRQDTTMQRAVQPFGTVISCNTGSSTPVIVAAKAGVGAAGGSRTGSTASPFHVYEDTEFKEGADEDAIAAATMAAPRQTSLPSPLPEARTAWPPPPPLSPSSQEAGHGAAMQALQQQLGALSALRRPWAVGDAVQVLDLLSRYADSDAYVVCRMLGALLDGAPLTVASVSAALRTGAQVQGELAGKARLAAARLVERAVKTRQPGAQTDRESLSHLVNDLDMFCAYPGYPAANAICAEARSILQGVIDAPESDCMTRCMLPAQRR